VLARYNYLAHLYFLLFQKNDQEAAVWTEAYGGIVVFIAYIEYGKGVSTFGCLFNGKFSIQSRGSVPMCAFQHNGGARQGFTGCFVYYQPLYCLCTGGGDQAG